jgi:hypothetical protein
VGVCLRGWPRGRLVFLWSKETAALISRSVLVVCVTVLSGACALQPNRQSQDLTNQNRLNMAEEGRKNLAAIAEALIAHRSDREQHSSVSESSRVNGQESPPASHHLPGPSMRNFVLPQAHIVRPPEGRMRRSHSSIVHYPDSFHHVVPPYTIVVPSPHPGTQCFADYLGGQRC